MEKYLSEHSGIVEIDFVSFLINNYGEEKTKKILYDFKFNNFHSVKTMKESLNDDGTIKPKNDGKSESKLLTYSEMLEIQNKKDREIFKKAETIKRGDKTYWKLKEAV
ncbi:MAG: hypothetical protein IPK06_04775 [Ignavibacteriae bacterium]|nr:hypothetical protein [Ignavibacteriota bacterium]